MVLARSSLALLRNSARVSAPSTVTATRQASTSSAVSSVAKKAASVANAAGSKLSSSLGGYREPVLYNAAVVRELLKQVYVAERLAPPTSVGEVTSTFQTLFTRARDPAYLRKIGANGEWARVAIYALEAYGIFTIGEMIGRRSLVGYNLD